MKRALLTLVKIFVATIAIGVIAKIIFLVTYLGRTSQLNVAETMAIFWHGLSLDISIASYVTTIPLLIMLIGVWCGWLVSDRVWRVMLRCYLAFITVVTALLTAVDANLYGYWGYRIDATLLPYLATPGDAAASITLPDVVRAMTVLIVMVITSLWLYCRATRNIGFSWIAPLRRLLFSVVMIILGGALFVGIRGGVTQAVANVSKVYFSSKPYVNHAAVNPVFSFISSLSRVKRYDHMYVAYEDDNELNRYFKMFQQGVADTTYHTPPPTLTTQRPNVAIIIAEGYTYNIMNMVVDGVPVMPNLKGLMQEGIAFNNTYASGGRTDKGVLSVLSGYPSQPKVSLMKIPSKNRNLPSIARTLGKEGYSSSFYYGGDLNFMDMSSYLYGTGWQTLQYDSGIDCTVEERRKWGWSDGVMMRFFADKIIDMSSDSAQQPFLAGLLTLSSHEPFDIPDEAVIKNPLIDSFRYSDRELGKMIAQLKESGAWDNLLMIIVADHCITYDFLNIPYNTPSHHHIPMVWCGGALTHSLSVDNIISQCDIPATLLSTLGLDTTDYLFSRDIFSGRNFSAFYTYNDGAGLIDNQGSMIYDNNLAKPIHNDAHPNSMEIGRAVLQQVHRTIEEL